MNSRERVAAVLAGQRPDRPPVSFWSHFPEGQIAGEGAVEAHMKQLEKYDLDFLKVMADSPYPHEGIIGSIQDLGTLGSLRGDEGGFGLQLELISALQRKIKRRVYMATTVFNAWMVLRMLVTPPKVHRPPNLDAGADGPSRWIREALDRAPERVGAALELIGKNLSRFAAKCIEAGADGIFLSVRDDWVDLGGAKRAGDSVYDRWVAPSDRTLLAGAAGAPFNMVHVCGRGEDFRRFAAYPAAVLHWADRAAGPAIRDVASWAKPALAGGVDNLGTLVTGTEEDVRREVRDALAQAGARPLIIAPGCTYDPHRVPEANLKAMVRATRE